MLNEKKKCITVNHLYEDGNNDYTGKMLRIFNNEETKRLTGLSSSSAACITAADINKFLW